MAEIRHEFMADSAAHHLETAARLILEERRESRKWCETAIAERFSLLNQLRQCQVERDEARARAELGMPSYFSDKWALRTGDDSAELEAVVAELGDLTAEWGHPLLPVIAPLILEARRKRDEARAFLDGLDIWLTEARNALTAAGTPDLTPDGKTALNVAQRIVLLAAERDAALARARVLEGRLASDLHEMDALKAARQETLNKWATGNSRLQTRIAELEAEGAANRRLREALDKFDDDRHGDCCKAGDLALVLRAALGGETSQ